MAKEANFERWLKTLSVEDASITMYTSQCGFCPVRKATYCEGRARDYHECLRIFREWAKLRT